MHPARLRSCERFAQEDKQIICYSCALKTNHNGNRILPRGNPEAFLKTVFPTSYHWNFWSVLSRIVKLLSKSCTLFQKSNLNSKLQGVLQCRNKLLNWQFIKFCLLRVGCVALQSAEAKCAALDLTSRMDSREKCDEDKSCTEPLQIFHLPAWLQKVCDLVGYPSSKEGWLPFICQHDRLITHLVREDQVRY